MFSPKCPAISQVISVKDFKLYTGSFIDFIDLSCFYFLLWQFKNHLKGACMTAQVIYKPMPGLFGNSPWENLILSLSI